MIEQSSETPGIEQPEYSRALEFMRKKCYARSKRVVDSLAEMFGLTVAGKTKQQLCAEINRVLTSAATLPSEIATCVYNHFKYEIQNEAKALDISTSHKSKSKLCREISATKSDRSKRMRIIERQMSESNIRTPSNLMTTTVKCLKDESFSANQYSHNALIKELSKAIEIMEVYVDRAIHFYEDENQYPEEQENKIMVLVHFKGLSANEALFVIMYEYLVRLWEDYYIHYTVSSQLEILEAMMMIFIADLDVYEVNVAKRNKPKRYETMEYLMSNDHGTGESFQIFLKLWAKLVYNDTSVVASEEILHAMAEVPRLTKYQKMIVTYSDIDKKYRLKESLESESEYHLTNN